MKTSSPTRWLTTIFLLATLLISAWAQEETNRKVKTQVAPQYPSLAKRNGISGTVKVLVTIAPAGGVTTAKATGGHPLLVESAVDAVKQWKFESAKEETRQTIEVKFTL